jgi:magnesium-transporting ATPase (P-type)
VAHAVSTAAASSFDFQNETVMYAITVVVAIIPESLPVMLTLNLAMGVRRMAALNVIVRKLPVLETLGRVVNICSDKTGTLTQAKMVAVNFWLPHRSYHVTGLGLEPKGEFMIDGQPVVPDAATMNALHVCGLCAESTISFDTASDQWLGLGSPTELALVVLANKAGIVRKTLTDTGEWMPLAEFPFDSSVKSMTMVMKRKVCVDSDRFV